jgi:N6-adenosine-specific RNA methylase IME4
MRELFYFDIECTGQYKDYESFLLNDERGAELFEKKKKKMGGGLGGVVRISSEFLLFCRKGNLKAIGNIPESVIEAKRPYVNGYPCHSKKPEIFRQLIESVTPSGNKLELFARHENEGWDLFGNEVNNSIKIGLK